MPSLREIVTHGHRIAAHRPWPRVVVSAEAWITVAGELAAGRATLLGLWASAGATNAVHMAGMAHDAKDSAVVSLECPQRRFPSVGVLHRPAIRLERAIHSLYGFEPVGAVDARPWLNLGFWDVQFPLGAKQPVTGTAGPYEFLPVEGE